MSVRVVDQGIIYHGTPGSDTASCGFPGVAALADGTLIATWRVGTRKESPDGRACLARSTDGGRTWSEPAFPFDDLTPKTPYEVLYAPLTVLPDGRLLATVLWVDRSEPTQPLFNPETGGIQPCRTYFLDSDDGGVTWTNLRQLDESDDGHLAAVTGPVLLLSDGRLASQFEYTKRYHDDGPWNHAAILRFSDDGWHWGGDVQVARDPTGKLKYFDARYAVGADGKVVAGFWTFDSIVERDVDIHLCESADDGRHWSAPHPTGLIGQVAHPVLCGDDGLVVIYVDRFSEQPSIRAAVSCDGGHTFTEEVIVYEHTGGLDPGKNSDLLEFLQDMGRWTFGRVDAVREKDGSIFVVHYGGNKTATNIHWARLAIV